MLLGSSGSVSLAKKVAFAWEYRASWRLKAACMSLTFAFRFNTRGEAPGLTVNLFFSSSIVRDAFWPGVGRKGSSDVAFRNLS
jgi:hypothetical protein